MDTRNRSLRQHRLPFLQHLLQRLLRRHNRLLRPLLRLLRLRQTRFWFKSMTLYGEAAFGGLKLLILKKCYQNNMLDQLGGRKFIGFIILLVMGFVFVLLSKLPVQDFMTWATAGLAIYTVGNVGSDVASGMKP